MLPLLGNEVERHDEHDININKSVAICAAMASAGSAGFMGKMLTRLKFSKFHHRGLNVLGIFLALNCLGHGAAVMAVALF